MIEAVIFDVDGVLVDSYHAHYAAWRRLLGERGVDYQEAAFVRSFGRRNREILRDVAAAHGWGELDDAQVLELAERKETYYRQELASHFPEMEGAGTLVEALHDDGILVAVGSSGPPENVEIVLERLGRERFQAVVTGTDVRRGKPDPEVFLVAAERLGVDPGRCAVVEDAPAGIRAARAAGMAAVAVVSTGHRAEDYDDLSPDLVVASPAELTPRALRGLAGPSGPRGAPPDHR